VPIASVPGESPVVESIAGAAGQRRCRDRGRCRMRVVGYLHGRGRRRADSDRRLLASVPGLDCENPLLVECQDCGRLDKWACTNHRQSKCRPCSARYRRRLVRIAESGTARTVGYLYLLTCTAPGDRAHTDTRTGRPCECTPTGGINLAEWNASHSRRWNHLRTVLRRDVPSLEFLRGVEVQKRGALHDHALVWSPVPLSQESLRRMAIRAGFGHSLDLAPVVPGSRKAAYYVSKYITKACDSRDEVPWVGEYVDRRTGEIKRGLITARYRTWSSSRSWGLTMRDVRAVCAEYARRRAELLSAQLITELCESLDGAVVVDGDPPPI